MQVSDIKSYAFEKLKIKLLLFTVAMSLFLAVLYYNFLVSQEQRQIEGAKSPVLQQVENVKNDVLKSQESLEYWNSGGSVKHAERGGLKVQKARSILDKLKETYRISNLTVTLSNPELRKDVEDNKFTGLSYSIVNMSFATYLDTDAFKFMDAITKEFPGYVQYIDVGMINQISSTETGTQLLQQKKVEQKKGKSDQFVSEGLGFSVSFIWQDIEDLKKDQGKSLTENEPVNNKVATK